MRRVSRRVLIPIAVCIVIALIGMAYVDKLFTAPTSPTMLTVSAPLVNGNNVGVIVCEPSSYYPDIIEMYFQDVSPTPTKGFVQAANYSTLPPGSNLGGSPLFIVPNNQTCTPAGLSVPAGETDTGRLYFVAEKSGLMSNVVEYTTNDTVISH